MIKIHKTDGVIHFFEIDERGWELLAATGRIDNVMYELFGGKTLDGATAALQRIGRAIFTPRIPEALVFVNADDENRVVCVECGLERESIDSHGLLLANESVFTCAECDTLQRIVLDEAQYDEMCQLVALPEDVTAPLCESEDGND